MLPGQTIRHVIFNRTKLVEIAKIQKSHCDILSHMPRTASFTLEKWAIWADCIFEIYRFRWRFWRKDRNRIYCRFWFTVFGIKGTAPSSENSKSFINQNVLVRPGLRKKNVEKISVFNKLRLVNYFEVFEHKRNSVI